eukprot:scaffold12163_cov176-Amphora_coffeaeformis.AAC.4
MAVIIETSSWRCSLYQATVMMCRLLVARVAKGCVSRGRLAHEAVFSVVVHTVSEHVFDLGTISKSVGEKHGTDDGVVYGHRASSVRARIDNRATRRAASAGNRFHRGDSTQRRFVGHGHQLLASRLFDVARRGLFTKVCEILGMKIL